MRLSDEDRGALLAATEGPRTCRVKLKWQHWCETVIRVISDPAVTRRDAFNLLVDKPWKAKALGMRFFYASGRCKKCGGNAAHVGNSCCYVCTPRR